MNRQVRWHEKVGVEEIPVHWVEQGFEVGKIPIEEFEAAVKAAKESEHRWVFK